MGHISSAWTAIDAWLAHHAPASARALPGPASAADLAAAEQALGLRFPPDFAESLSHHDGQADDCTDFPGTRLLSLEEIVATREDLVETAEDELGRDDADDWWWHEQWLPIGDLDADVLVLDCRPGAGYGRVGFRSKDDVADFEPGSGWSSFTAYLGEMAAAFADGRTTEGLIPHLTTEGTLFWEHEIDDPELTPIRLNG
ncbi:SMI1/KNR4 family protein [Amycolatopsis jejuensis]|uniref:SMI1/KNR4 family protein n=1 Tax=Amycolatopsis jejuensis TaxID=330084 RepID=UPI00068D08EE|nr:SMI1/KNR4 family protein [Amycolatopsis jejuensis]